MTCTRSGGLYEEERGKKYNERASMVQITQTLWITVKTLEFTLIILRSQQRDLSSRIIQLSYPIRRSLWLLCGKYVFGRQEKNQGKQKAMIGGAFCGESILRNVDQNTELINIRLR